MSKVDDGGAAFPGPKGIMHEFADDGKQIGSYVTMYNVGMTLRDYFAAKAMVELTADAIVRMRSVATHPPDRTGMDDQEFNDGSEVTWSEGIAVEAYIIADAMLAARKATQ